MLTQPRVDLYDRVTNRIIREEKLKVVKKRLILEFFVFILSFFVFIPMTLKLISDIAVSGLTEFLSLLFTDFAVVMANIGDYVLSLLESAPFFSLSLTLAVLLFIVFDLAKIADSYSDFKKINVN
jgi:hypothetical protein